MDNPIRFIDPDGNSVNNPYAININETAYIEYTEKWQDWCNTQNENNNASHKTTDSYNVSATSWSTPFADKAGNKVHSYENSDGKVVIVSADAGLDLKAFNKWFDKNYAGNDMYINAINGSTNSSVDGEQMPGMLFGTSVDATIAVGGLGYTGEVGSVNGTNTPLTQLASHGRAAGFEASAGFNFNLIVPLKNTFTVNDLGGMSQSYGFNWGAFSIAIFGNSSPSYPENTLFDSYVGFRIGIGIGIGGSSSNTNTSINKADRDYNELFLKNSKF